MKLEIEGLNINRGSGYVPRVGCEIGEKDILERVR